MTAAQWLKEQTYPAEDQNLAASAAVYLRKGEGRSLKAGGQWIYDNEIDRTVLCPGPELLSESGQAGGNASSASSGTPGAAGKTGKEKAEGKPAIQDGDIIHVLDYDGYPLGIGFFNSNSKIRIRMLTRYQTEAFTPALLRKRVRDAWTYRRAVMGKDTDSCRVVFGEADYLPGITIDKYGDVLVIESLALGTDRLKLLILHYLAEALEEDGITVRGIYERSDAKVRRLEGMEQCKGFIGPSFDTAVPIMENGIRYIVDVKDGQKTGFFLDQKYNRAAIARIARHLAEDRKRLGADPVRVLDCFTHTGSFGLNCALAGAGCVLSVDASELAIRQAAENASLNGYSESGQAAGMAGSSPAGGRKRVRMENPETGGIIVYQAADVFELLPALEKAGEKFDIVILDPPAFTKSRQAVKNAVKGYREINLRGLKLVKDGGYLATCSCSHFMGEELFRKTVAQAAHGARKRLRQIEFRTQAPDHPILWGDAESYYLKFGIFQAADEL